MKIYQLEPVEISLNIPAWQASTYKGRVKIRAASEDRARDIAYGRFGIAVEKTAAGQSTPENPWRKSNGLVNCQEIGEDDSSEESILEPEGYE